MPGAGKGNARRWLAVAPAVALASAGLTVLTGPSASQAQPTSAQIGLDEFYINYAAPRAEPEAQPEEVVGSKGSRVLSAPAVAEEVDQKFASGNPAAAQQLADAEATAERTGNSPKEQLDKLKDRFFKKADQTQVAKLLTILVEFNDEANDDFTGVQVPATVSGDRTCAPGNVQNGPLHNGLPNPATLAQADNNSMWVPDFSSEFYNKLLYTEKGVTERVRTDLTGPDGKAGISLAGLTMHNMYLEMSKGAYTVDGAATPWITVPHSEGWYGASVCHQDDDGSWVAGAPQDMQGHPDNPLGAQQLAIDSIAALAETDPDFPWADYDIEDQGDRDGDGNIFEPDGVIDHLVLVHAGADKSGDGGDQGTYAIWAHSSAVAGGAEIPGTDLKISNYIVQPEDSGVGVFAHEYGHDLGLPDLYDTSGGAESDIDFWDLMSSGSHSGPIFQSMPTHMGLWDKYVLGWADPVEFDPGDRAKSLLVGQSSRTPKNTADGVKVNLPDKVVTLTTPHSGQNAWWTGNDQDWGDRRLTRAVDVPAGSDVRFWMWNDYIIEEDWDFGFVEVSTDGGATWNELKIFDETGALVSTDDGYADPNGNMATFGGKKYGLTGNSHGWRHDYVDLTSYAGQSVQLRLRMTTDAAFQERGWFADDFSVTADGTTTWSDDVEGGANGWVNTVTSFADTTGPGWRLDTGTHIFENYYLVEWRNEDGFDKGLKYGYDSTYLRDDAWKVEKIDYNAPGMLVWYRDAAWGDVNHVTSNLSAAPSHGSKGQLLLVDSHFDPLRRAGDAAVKDPTTLDNLPSRPQSSNVAFSLQNTTPFRECLEAAGEPFSEYCTNFPAQAPVSVFTDNLGWYPGFELRDDGRLFYRDIDASVVVPSRGSAPYSVRIVDQRGNPLPDLYGEDVGVGVPLGTGNPADTGVAYGTKFEVKNSLLGNTMALIKITPPAAD